MKAVVKTAIAPLRAHACDTAERVDEALYGWGVEILSNDGNFHHVRTDYGYYGYICESDLEKSPPIVGRAQMRRISVSFADALDEPKVQGDVLITLPRGADVAIFGEVGRYTCVFLADGRTAYVRTAFLEVPRANPFRESIMATAVQYLGTQYRWGGKTHAGIDCSGLTFMSYHLNGVNIWRDAHYKQGFPIKKIPLEDARPADLLYFPGHVAMLLDNDRIIHSSHANDGVMIEQMADIQDLMDTLLYCGSIF